MALQKERESLKKCYRSEAWSRKVDRMSDAQVAAIYLRLKQQAKVS